MAKINATSFKNLEKVIINKMLLPRLKVMRTDTIGNIERRAQRFRGSSDISVADRQAIAGGSFSSINKKRLRARIRPITSKIEAFERNIDGYDISQYVYVDQVPGLTAWVNEKYNGGDKGSILAGSKPLRIRARSEPGVDAPLGSPERDFFGLGFRDLISDLNKYGLTR